MYCANFANDFSLSDESEFQWILLIEDYSFPLPNLRLIATLKGLLVTLYCGKELVMLS